MPVFWTSKKGVRWIFQSLLFVKPLFFSIHSFQFLPFFWGLVRWSISPLNHFQIKNSTIEAFIWLAFHPSRLWLSGSHQRCLLVYQAKGIDLILKRCYTVEDGACHLHRRQPLFTIIIKQLRCGKVEEIVWHAFPKMILWSMLRFSRFFTRYTTAPRFWAASWSLE